MRTYSLKSRNSLNCLGTGTIETLSSPPQNKGSSEDFLGVSCLTQASTFVESAVQDNGPNNGYRFVTQVSPQNNGRPTTFEYIVVTDLLSSSSPFFVAQCGNFNAQTNPNGFISGTQLEMNVFDHESGTVLSHWTNYVQAQNNPSNNIGLTMEGEIGIPGIAKSEFDQNINSAVSDLIERIKAASGVEPCGGDARRDSNQSCAFFGNINFANQTCN